MELLALDDYDARRSFQRSTSRALTADRRISARMNYCNSLSGPVINHLALQVLPLGLAFLHGLQPPGGLESSRPSQALASV